MIKVTLDTNVFPADDLIQAAAPFDCSFAVVTVTERELEGTSFEVQLSPFDRLPETAVYGEARYDQAVYASEPSAERIEMILKIISSGSLPSSRSTLSKGERKHLRDALILEAHVRDGRDIFITSDKRGFIKDGKREKLNAAFKVRILTPSEFLDACAGNQLTSG